jgi:hypothetical protein
VRRKTIRKRVRAKLREIKQQPRERMHDPVRQWCNRDLYEAAGAADATACSRIGSCGGVEERSKLGHRKRRSP